MVGEGEEAEEDKVIFFCLSYLLLPSLIFFFLL